MIALLAGAELEDGSVCVGNEAQTPRAPRWDTARIAKAARICSQGGTDVVWQARPL